MNLQEAFPWKGKAYFDYGMLHEWATDLEWVAAGNDPVAGNTTGDIVPIPHSKNERPVNLPQDASSAAVAQIVSTCAIWRFARLLPS